MTLKVPAWAPAAAIELARRSEEELRAFLLAAVAESVSEAELAERLGVPRVTLRRQAAALGVSLPRGAAGNPAWRRKTPEK